jgi:hypothetical protein
LLGETDVMPTIEFRLIGSGTVEGLPEGIGPTVINVSDLDAGFTSNTQDDEDKGEDSDTK